MILKRQHNIRPGSLSSNSFASTDLRISNRDKLGNRNRRKAPVTNNLIFPNRDRIRGVSGLRDEVPSRSSVEPQASSFQNLIATQISRNHLNSHDINANCHSNRNKRKGSRGPGEGRTGDTKGGSDARRACGRPPHFVQGKPALHLNLRGTREDFCGSEGEGVIVWRCVCCSCNTFRYDGRGCKVTLAAFFALRLEAVEKHK
jgi:hypothetical protein